MHGRAKQFGERIMVSGPTSRAVGRLLKKKKKKKMMKSRFCRFPYLTLTGRSSDARILYG